MNSKAVAFFGPFGFLIGLSFLLLPLVSGVVLANNHEFEPAPEAVDTAGLVVIIETISQWLLTFLLALVVIFVLWAAFLFLTAGGDPGRVSEARQRLLYAAAGVVVALLAWSVVPIIRAITGL